MPVPPTLLVDNVFDRVHLYPAATLTASSEATGHGVRYAADYRRERTSWQATDAGVNPTGGWVMTNLGAGNTRAVNAAWLDRGHNLWGKTVVVEGGDDGATFPTTLRSAVVPALDAAGNYVVGGDPTTGWCVTEEGAAYTLAGALTTARQYWRVRAPYVAAFTPAMTGVLVGQYTRFLGFLSTRDEDASERTQASEQSLVGYRGYDRTYSWRVGEMGFESIGGTEYDTTMRWLHARIFQRNQPFLLIHEAVGVPERAWLMQFDGARWSFGMRRVTRGGRIPIRECGHLLTPRL